LPRYQAFISVSSLRFVVARLSGLWLALVFPQNKAKRLTQPHLTMLSVISASLWRTTANFRIWGRSASRYRTALFFSEND
jgi:hypothetical protein